ncbi:hypothetical protein K3172_12890 [Qipengyuania sp. 6B39]|uniref:phage tail protein n=1 Tax=Qipengyuania proteolytica TaxID=2867239 RepID=UPI001C897503|nr:phage tail protein [Qipengyuania proteolytica]MBX7496755.1 hypothetical protein [Qipengyuania proteolytica]
MAALMSGVLRAVGQVAGVVATVAAFIPGGQPIAAIAAAVATVSSLGAAALQKPPRNVGQVNERVIGANNPLPYLIGRSYSGGVQVHDVGWGGTVNKVENPYRFIATVHSCCGPIDGLESVQFDYGTIPFSGDAATGYYANYVWRDFQLGARPETDELQPHWSGTPDWGSAYKLSGMAALGVSLQWSKKGKRFAGGQIPAIGAIWRGVKVYDPRLDSTFPGGSGTCRVDDETTWVYSRDPALHAGTYGYGRYVNGIKVFGVDLGEEAVDFASVAAWANVNDANGWTANGTIYEPGDKWNNLKLIAEAGGGEPVLANGVLRFDFEAPRTSLATIGRDDLADGPVTAKLGRGWKNRHNTLVPKYRSEAHQWGYEQAAAAQVAAWVTEDGEEKIDQYQWDLVTDVDQVTELALYKLYRRRQDGPIRLTCKPHMMLYGPGDCLTLDAELGVHPENHDGTDTKVVIRRRSIDPVAGTVTFEFEREDDAKHAAALGATGTAPPVRTVPTPEDIDGVVGGNILPDGYERTLIATSSQSLFTLTATDADITIGNHNRIYADGTVAVTGATITTEDDGTTAIASETRYWLYYDDSDRSGGAVSWQATTSFDTAQNSDINPDRHFGGYITTDVSGGSGTSGGGSLPPGTGGGDPYA